MSDKAILVILDGLNGTVGLNCMGFMQALCEQSRGQAYILQSELPSMSRPLYECLLTGIRPIDSGIYHNQVQRLSQEQSIFHYCLQEGKTTAAAAYHWFSELYNRGPFDASVDRYVNDQKLPIQFGHFYYDDVYPDSHVFDDAEHLRSTYRPDFLLVHPMNIDDTGHKYGIDSAEYRNAARKADVYLSKYLNIWLQDGYQIIVTADHGMNNDFTHGGILLEEREVPLYVFGDKFSYSKDINKISQTQLCGTICELLKVNHDKPICRALLK